MLQQDKTALVSFYAMDGYYGQVGAVYLVDGIMRNKDTKFGLSCPNCGCGQCGQWTPWTHLQGKVRDVSWIQDAAAWCPAPAAQRNKNRSSFL